MQTLAHEILAFAASLPEGEPLQAKALLHLGNRAAIDQALSRLAGRGQVTRAGRGLYLVPVETRFGTRAPEPGKVMEAIARASGETIASSGATAANALGLTTQIPIRMVYLTSGKSRTIVLGSPKLGSPKATSRAPAFGTAPAAIETAAATLPFEVELRHAPRWQLVLAGRLSGEVIRAIAWAAGESPRTAAGRSGRRAGRKPGRIPRARWASANLARMNAATATLRQVLEELPAGAREELIRARPSLPSWIAEPVSRIMAHA